MMSQITIYLAEGFEEIEAVTIIDVLRRAGLNAVTVSITGGYFVNGAHNIQIKTDLLFEEVDFDKCKMIVLPGGMPGARNLNEHEGLKARIMEFHENDKLLGAICAAPLVFGNLGILMGKRAVCYPGFESFLQGADVMTNPVLIDGNIITARGVGAALHFALEIVRILAGDDLADKLGKAMLINSI